MTDSGGVGLPSAFELLPDYPFRDPQGAPDPAREPALHEVFPVDEEDWIAGRGVRILIHGFGVLRDCLDPRRGRAHAILNLLNLLAGGGLAVPVKRQSEALEESLDVLWLVEGRESTPSGMSVPVAFRAASTGLLTRPDAGFSQGRSRLRSLPTDQSDSHFALSES